MSILDALVLAVVEGLTEFLPVSSTGHLILAADLLSLPDNAFTTSFTIAIQLGAILAVVALYWRTLLTNRRIVRAVVIAFLPSAVVGFAFYPFIKNVLLESTAVTLYALFLGGIALIGFERWYARRGVAGGEGVPTWRQALLIGAFQACAIVPGVSRAAATIIGGLVSGMRREAAVEFSFLLAVPTMFAATSLDFLETRLAFRGEDFAALGIGFIGAFVTALLAIKFFLHYVQRHSFVPFGIYRMALAALLAFFML